MVVCFVAIAFKPATSSITDPKTYVDKMKELIDSVRAAGHV